MTDLTYECDCCGAKVPRNQIAMVIAYGIETGACCACRGVEPDPEGDDDDPFHVEQKAR